MQAQYKAKEKVIKMHESEHNTKVMFSFVQTIFIEVDIFRISLYPHNQTKSICLGVLFVS